MILGRMAFYFGDSLTRASRLAPTSLARLSMGVLRPNLERRIFGSAGGVADAVFAVQLPDFLLSLSLPPMWQIGALTGVQVQRELTDTIRYCYGSNEDRRAVETSRLSSTTRYTHHQPYGLVALRLLRGMPCKPSDVYPACSLSDAHPAPSHALTCLLRHLHACHASQAMSIPLASLAMPIPL